MATAKTVTSASVICYINGAPFGRVMSFSWSTSTPKRPIYGLDSMEPFELMATTSRVAGNMSLVRTHGDGGAEGAGMVAPFGDLPREKYFSLTLLDRATGAIIFEARYCSVMNQSWNVPERGIVTGRVDFEALDYSNEIKLFK